MDVANAIKHAVESTGIQHEFIPIDPTFSDTTEFCVAYGFSPEITANTILVSTKTNPKKFCACVVLATTKLDFNHCVKGLMNAHVSFVSVEDMKSLTGMEVGAVTPFGLPPGIPIFMEYLPGQKL